MERENQHTDDNRSIDEPAQGHSVLRLFSCVSRWFLKEGFHIKIYAIIVEASGPNHVTAMCRIPSLIPNSPPLFEDVEVFKKIF